MPPRCRQTFWETLLAVAPRNAQALEHKARTASSLAVTYPENESVFRTIESDAIQQVFRILVYVPGIRDIWAALGQPPDRELTEASLATD